MFFVEKLKMDLVLVSIIVVIVLDCIFTGKLCRFTYATGGLGPAT